MSESTIVLSHAAAVLRTTLNTQTAPLRMMTERAIELLEAMRPTEPQDQPFLSWGDDLLSLGLRMETPPPETQEQKNAIG